MNLRLLADDLTGALDAAAAFASPSRPVPVYFSGRAPSDSPPALALDMATREREAGAAAAIAAGFAPLLEPAAGGVAFLKVDSQLRGHAGAELASILRAGRFAACVIAPAFPFHGRVTRGGRQFLRSGDAWRTVGEDIRASLEASGHSVAAARPGDPVPPGISLWDAETDEDLRRIAAAGKRPGPPLLWCGSGGLAAALAGGGTPLPAGLERPILGIFGSDHPATAAQLAACGSLALHLAGGGEGDAARLASRLGLSGIGLVRFDLAAGLERSAAADRIAAETAALVARIPAPRTLIVAGGETLRALCLAVQADRLEVGGELLPGVPFSILRGGRWSGVRVVSKSGAFGTDSLLQQILALDPAFVMQNRSG